MKYCPLKFQNALWTEACYCEETQCAWWDEFTGHCAILSISRHGGKGSFEIVKEERGK